jgi:DMSO/TMAO reductase YedYZ molybdopterin-dependent catalytic subunit
MREAPFAPFSIAERIIRESPGPLVTWGIEQMGHNAMQLLAWGSVVAALPLAWLMGRRHPVLFGSLAFLVTIFAARIDPQQGEWGPTLLSAAVASIAATLAAAIFMPVPEGDTEANPTRRRLLAGGVLGMLLWATGAGAIIRRQTEEEPSGPVRADSPARIPPDTSFEQVRGLSPRITPTDSHYVVDIGIENPHLGDGWRLKVKGRVESELSLSLSDLRDMTTAETLMIMQCISNRIGGGLAGNSKWTGISTASILDMVRPHDNARWAVARSADGFTDVLRIESLQDPDTMIAFGMNGSVLPREHGYPARLLYPGHYGMRSVKWIEELEFLDHDDEGYWAARGWDREALMRTGSRIDTPGNDDDVPGSFTVAGVAWAGDRQISKVEVSTDEGATWQEAQLENELGRLSWRRWQIDYQLESGDYKILARAYDGTGAVQDEEERKPHPSGASGYHSISVNVRSA